MRRFHAAGANVVAADVLDASPVAEPLGRAVAVHADVSTEAGNVALIDAAVAAFGPVDLFFANAGLAIGTDLTMPEQEWELAMHVNVNAHRWAAKHLLDGWLARGSGYFCSTASAAGLLAQIGSLGYTVTKRAAVAFAEWLSITYGDQGVRVSCLCPQGVNTDMLNAVARPRPGGGAGGRRRARAGRGGGGHDRGDRRGALPRAPPPRGRRVRHAQGERRGVVAGRDAPAAGADRRGLGAGLRSTG